MNSEALDRLTADILTSLGNAPELIEALVAESGLDPADLRRMAGSSGRELSTALLDFICGNDERLMGFCDSSGWPVQRVIYAREALEAGALR